MRLQSSGELPNAASQDNWNFGWKFFTEQAKDSHENQLFSPYSISTIGAMLVAGANGETKSEIDTALSFSSNASPAFHQFRNSLAQALQTRNHSRAAQVDEQVLRVSNDIWLDPAFNPSGNFLDTLSAYYGAGTFLAPFSSEPEVARSAINEKVARDTERLIEELLPANSVDGASLVLTNALYFKANWATMFSKADTAPRVFVNASGESESVPMMRLELEAQYFHGSNYDAVVLPYAGGEIEFGAIMPSAGAFASFTQTLTAETVTAAMSGLRTTALNLSLPNFEIKTKVPLKERLQANGMRRAFDPDLAEFEGLSSDLPVYVTSAFHDASLKVDEGGTEAAAATAVAVAVTVSPPEDPRGLAVTLDHPFVFFIRDVETSALLFVGQLASP